MRRESAGFSLIEVLAALALLALLLVGVYSGVRTAIRSVVVGNAAIEQWDQIRSAQQMLCRELSQSMALPLAKSDHGERLYFIGDQRKLRFVAPLPGYLGQRGPQMQQISLESDAHGAMRLVARFALIPPDGSAPQFSGEPEVLMENISRGAFSYRGKDRQGHMSDWRPDWPDGRLLPSLVRIELTLLGRHDWPTLEVPLRIDPSANRGATDLLHPMFSSSP